jgi:hypothetical protein
MRAILALPSFYIIPGVILLTALRRSINDIVMLTVEGFFVSILMSVLLTSIMLALGLPLIPFNYSLATLIVTLSLSIIALVRKIEFKPSESGTLLVTVAFLAYVALLIYFGGLPRLFTPDETSYIFSARMGILNDAVPPMGVRPNTGEINALLQGRYFWIYLLASFIGSTDLPAHQAGLLGASFLVMTALASSLLVKKKWLRTAVFTIVTLNPLLFLFSALTLNDLAISFYAVFAVLFFVKSFSKTDNNVSISIKNLLYSLLGLIVLTMIKPNLMVFVAMWIILVYIMLRYKLYKQNLKYKVLLMAVVLPVLIYELCVDIPYVVSVWILRSRELADLFGKFLFTSPAERFLGWFVAPWWNLVAPTLFTRSFADYMDYFYRILMPESSSILVSAIILALPILILSRSLRKKLDATVLTSLVLLSLWLFYFEALSSASLSDASRYSLWMIPLWIPLALIVLQDIIKDSSPLRKLLPVSIAALVLLWVNIWLSKEKGGVYIGYDLPSRLWTADAIIVQLISLTAILSLLLLREDLLKVRLTISRKLSTVKTLDLRATVFSLVIILMLLNGAYFSFQFVANSQRYEDHGFTAINNALDDVSSYGSLVFANNYIYMRPYVNDALLHQGLLLPPPDTKDEFLKLLKVAPNNTLFLISNDDTTTWYEYANKYIKGYTYSDTITSEKPDVSKLPKFNLTEPILKMTFDDANETTIIDHSRFGNDGVNYGASIVEGYYGNSLRFDGKEYVSIPGNDALNVQDSITISFLAKIERAEPLKGYMILSKGYAIKNGSYDIFIWDGKICFELGEVGWVSVPVEPYVGAWHHFVFTYDGEKMEIYIDGSSKVSKPASGLIRVSTFDLEVGRDGERKAYYYIGLIDELQVSNKRLDIRELVESYYTTYALKICKLSLPKGQAGLFSLVSDGNAGQHITVESSKVYVNENRTVTVEVQIESQKIKNVSILIATDRFTKVYITPLDTGLNNVSFQFDYIVDSSWYEPGGFYWLHLAQTRVIVIEDGSIVYNNFITTQNLYLMNILHLMLLSEILVAFLIPQFKYHVL